MKCWYSIYSIKYLHEFDCSVLHVDMTNLCVVTGERYEAPLPCLLAAHEPHLSLKPPQTTVDLRLTMGFDNGRAPARGWREAYHCRVNSDFPIHFVTHRQLKTDTFTPPNFTSKLNAEIINKLMNHCLQVELFQGRTVFPLVCRSEMTKDRYFTPPNSSVYCSPQRQANWIQKLNN